MKTKGFSLRRMLARRDQVFLRALRPYIAARLVGDTIRDIANDIAAELPQTVSRDALFESVRVLAGTTLSQRDAKDLAWRLAGNIDQLIAGRPVLPWVRQISNEVIPVRAERIRYEKRRDIPGYTLFCRALAGAPCPMVFPQWLSNRSCKAISRTLGFSAPWGLYPYSAPLHFVNLVFFAHIEANKSNETPYFKQVSASSGLKAENKTRIAVRTRALPCPRGYTHECVKCWVGYNECPAAIYPRTLVQRECSSCASVAYFEPDDESTMCIGCRNAQHHP
jgi:hypothetical protein